LPGLKYSLEEKKGDIKQKKPIELSLEFGVWTLECGVWSLDFGLWSLEFGVWNLEFGVWNLEFGAYQSLINMLQTVLWSCGDSNSGPDKAPKSFLHV
jgi:hypothetical protein